MTVPAIVECRFAWKCPKCQRWMGATARACVCGTVRPANNEGKPLVLPTAHRHHHEHYDDHNRQRDDHAWKCKSCDRWMGATETVCLCGAEKPQSRGSAEARGREGETAPGAGGGEEMGEVEIDACKCGCGCGK